MNSAWWIESGQLDDDQKAVMELTIDDSHFVIGPPGSGKTNLLLLRAKYLILAGHHNIRIITFTRSLRDFMASGSTNYQLPSDRIMTWMKWGHELLREYGRRSSGEGSFDVARSNLMQAVEKLVEDKGLDGIYDSILLDEAQDYSPDEIHLFHRLGRTLFAVADSRQKIYDTAESFAATANLIGNPHELTHHYRNGLKICQLADQIPKPEKNYSPI